MSSASVPRCAAALGRAKRWASGCALVWARVRPAPGRLSDLKAGVVARLRLSPVAAVKAHDAGDSVGNGGAADGRCLIPVSPERDRPSTRLIAPARVGFKPQPGTT